MDSPDTKTIKRLFAVSGNRCAFPDCGQALVTESGVILGQICHISAQSGRGPRFGALGQGEIHGFANLILLCPTHHVLVDKDAETFTVQALEAMKAAAQSPYGVELTEVEAEEVTLEVIQAAGSYLPLVPIQVSIGDARMKVLGLIDTGAEASVVPNEIVAALGAEVEVTAVLEVFTPGGQTEFQRIRGQLSWEGHVFCSEFLVGAVNYLLLGRSDFLSTFNMSFEFAGRPPVISLTRST